ncbi:transmembrane protein 51a [Xiphias gladius]|uniref:transmembrane protein 51a n=1 Tax=Xiphias gladius TaxID=8245 RepID=UPI001A98AA3A|nr:transmembrane protein 51a [Xiphias gladius]XP_040008335.1 transmembrane protein 51a [Xiphias gladius]XP_040008336.1 transmembrane protein 51a [Xiphias gladius]
MRSTIDIPPSSLGRGVTGSSNNNNNSSSRENSGNSGSQYALCALGVGLIALGIVMIVWSVVPADAASNSSSSSGDNTNNGQRKNKTSSVAFVLVGSGVVMLLLSLCVGMRNKQREQQRLQEAQNHGGVAARQQGERDIAEEQAQQYAVPTYEEVVGSGQYPVCQSNHRPSSSHLPSYDDLVEVDGVQYECEGPEVTTTGSQPAPASSAPASNRRPGKNSRKLLPIKIRRIKSEKLHMKNIGNSQPAAGISIEPLTPPPQYEDKVPQL